jgi:hypothetical protein
MCSENISVRVAKNEKYSADNSGIFFSYARSSGVGYKEVYYEC